MTKDPYYLTTGKHDDPEDGRCAMEWVAYLAGEPHTDTPVCVSPVLTRFCFAFNDALDDEKRQRLRPYLARTIGTRDDGLDEHRTWLATDWLIRTHTPAWLDLAGLGDAAQRLRTLPPVLAVENLRRAMVDLKHAQQKAAAAGSAPGSAAWVAAGAAAWVAAGDVAGAAGWAAARIAAGAAGWAAARDALVPTVNDLQESAFDLLNRMLPTEPVRLPVVADAEAVCALA